jgi:hypothetical protein
MTIPAKAVDVWLSGVAWHHLYDTSPGSLSDDQLDQWGYEMPYLEGREEEAERFVFEVRDAIRNPIERRRAGRFGSRCLVRFTKYEHALACIDKLEHVGEDFASGLGGFDAETRAEGRQLVKAALSMREQLVRMEEARR